MASHPAPDPRADREARRAVLQDALSDLPNAVDADRAAQDVLRALDSYIAAAAPQLGTPREPPVADFGRQEGRQVRWATWLVLGGAVLSTVIVAIVLSGGWPAGLAIIAIWLVALFVLAQT
jgi:hypothetical protein